MRQYRRICHLNRTLLEINCQEISQVSKTGTTNTSSTPFAILKNLASGSAALLVEANLNGILYQRGVGDDRRRQKAATSADGGYPAADAPAEGELGTKRLHLRVGLKRPDCNHGQEKAYRAPSTPSPASLGRARRGENPASNFVVTNTGDTGSGSLRQAILDSNATTGPNTITFAITTGTAPYVINLLSPLPPITVPVVLDGTPPGYSGPPLIEINGGGMLGDGLVLAPGSDGSTIEGLDIVGFPENHL